MGYFCTSPTRNLLYETVLIPTAVYEELLDERAGEDVITAVQSTIWLKIQVVQNQELVSELRNLINLGEAEAIALAIEVNAARLLIDERLGRQAAADRRLRITGIFGVLLTAKRQGLITAIKPVMDDLVAKANFRVSSQLYAEVLMTANE
ncbi:MAG: DUF3368 domain-containing protein [Nostoc sp.]|uniref:DUF3368 domain-containing protein n=1 Tax=Nostoc sp. TaxID=1180 RepID=UPI002FF7CC06